MNFSKKIVSIIAILSFLVIFAEQKTIADQYNNDILKENGIQDRWLCRRFFGIIAHELSQDIQKLENCKDKLCKAESLDDQCKQMRIDLDKKAFLQNFYSMKSNGNDGDANRLYRSTRREFNIGKIADLVTEEDTKHRGVLLQIQPLMSLKERYEKEFSSTFSFSDDFSDLADKLVTREIPFEEAYNELKAIIEQVVEKVSTIRGRGKEFETIAVKVKDGKITLKKADEEVERVSRLVTSEEKAIIGKGEGFRSIADELRAGNLTIQEAKDKVGTLDSNVRKIRTKGEEFRPIADKLLDGELTIEEAKDEVVRMLDSNQEAKGKGFRFIADKLLDRELTVQKAKDEVRTLDSNMSKIRAKGKAFEDIADEFVNGKITREEANNRFRTLSSKSPPARVSDRIGVKNGRKEFDDKKGVLRIETAEGDESEIEGEIEIGRIVSRVEVETGRGARSRIKERLRDEEEGIGKELVIKGAGVAELEEGGDIRHTGLKIEEGNVDIVGKELETKSVKMTGKSSTGVEIFSDGRSGRIRAEGDIEIGEESRLKLKFRESNTKGAGRKEFDGKEYEVMVAGGEIRGEFGERVDIKKEGRGILIYELGIDDNSKLKVKSYEGFSLLPELTQNEKAMGEVWDGILEGEEGEEKRDILEKRVGIKGVVAAKGMIGKESGYFLANAIRSGGKENSRRYVYSKIGKKDIKARGRGREG
ncbi:MAG: hypothetical protein LBT18_05275, partial [Endomicrobium sp.]|nr:hypothetical protein [Endomicrobium sp.]